MEVNKWQKLSQITYVKTEIATRGTMEAEIIIMLVTIVTNRLTGGL